MRWLGRSGNTHAVGLALAIAIALFGAMAHADERTDEASAHFTEGVEAFSKGDARRAAAAFAEAHRLVPHGATVYNAGLAWEAAGEPARAAQAFDEALRRGGLTDEQVTDTRTRLGRLEPTLGRVRVASPDGTSVSLAHVTRGKPGIAIYVKPGRHAVSVTYADGRTERRFVEVGTALVEVSFKDTAADTAPFPTPAPASPAREVATSSGSGPTLGWVAVGTSGVLAGAAVYMGLEALSARDAFNDSGQTDASAHDRAASLRTWTNVAWGASVITGGVGVWLLLTPEDETSEAPDGVARRGTSMRVTPGGVALEGRF